MESSSAAELSGIVLGGTGLIRRYVIVGPAHLIVLVDA
jgi:hypothetical protein